MPETVLKLVHTLPDGQSQEFVLSGGATLGRGSVNDIVLDDPKVSRIHARVETNGETVLQDLGSTNGTYVNGVRVTSQKLKPGDGILLGEAALRFEEGAPPSADVEKLDSQSDLDATMIGAAVPTVIRDTRRPRLAVHAGGRTWEVDLNTDALTIGRGADSDIRLEDRAVSRHHARLERRGHAFVIKDLGSANGTRVNGRKVDEHSLGAGETVQIGAAQLLLMQGFDPDALTVVDAPARPDGNARRPVVFIPGAMGSELWRGSERVWPNVKFMFTEPEAFRLPEERPLEPGGPIRELVIVPNFIKLERYSRLMEYLEESLGYETGKDLLGFGYDWRQDIRTASRRLARAIEEWDPPGPITIIAHSMGCMVARYYVERLGGKSKVERLLLLGGPHGGCPKVACSITRGNLLPLGIMGDRIRDILSTFPSLYQVLPTAACVVDQEGRPIKMMEDEGWLSGQERALLGMGRDFRRELPARSSVPCVSVIGYGMKTLTRFQIRRSPKGLWQEIGLLSEPAGDDTIPESAAIVEGSDVHPVQQHHSSLFVDNDVKMRLKLELTRPARPVRSR